MLILGKPGPKLPFYVNIKLFQSLKNRLSSRQLRGKVENFEIVAILNQYKDTLDHFTNSSYPESLGRVWPIDKRFGNAPMSNDSSTDLSARDCLDKELTKKLSWLAAKIKNLQVRHHYVVPPQPGYKKIQSKEKTVVEIRKPRW